MGRMDGKIAVVTGSTSGIGATVAKAFAAEGAKVVINGRNEQRGNEVLNDIKEAGGEAIFVQGDLRKREDLDKLVEETHAAFGKVNVLYNALGILRPGPFLESTDQDLMDIFETNYRSYVWTMQAFIPDMVELDGGSIVNIASVSAIWPELNAYHYGAMKSAIVNLSKNVAKEFAANHVRVNCILPGPVLTGMTPKEVVDNPEAMESLVSVNCLLGRILYPEDFIGGSLFLASDESSMVTGTYFSIDAGTTISNPHG